mmetsp:Transcript_17236/g.20735  ORF Transcript_17236/g.20735 Transcript_17236/m.20735 type:complete len:166 (-) Transcript_17236:552-1049(-)|eukprot:CAMPEP_0197846204 /NCGR_PEP_ID=MMETSP1438-20131217/2990_1 /TAXON_ID=1461541 /ORGANISM="Pterosperma sp., Strain CCMP1384" /LENGTH=165 /DNA_ID=CAMNT_0043457767 /DNA_START=418 /DNA_END=915 /DNA_ORIENTATION=+
MPTPREGEGSAVSEELYIACSEGKLEEVKRLYEELGAHCLDQLDEDKQVALHHVANGSEDNLELAEYVAQRSRKNTVGLKDAYDMTPFHIACENGHFEMVRYLTTLKDFNPELRRNSAAFLAARHEHKKLLDFLVNEQQTGSPTVESTSGSPPPGKANSRKCFIC